MSNIKDDWLKHTKPYRWDLFAELLKWQLVFKYRNLVEAGVITANEGWHLCLYYYKLRKLEFFYG